MFTETNPSSTGHAGSSWTDKEKFNAYMHGVSSNYPDATTYDNLGDRAKIVLITWELRIQMMQKQQLIML